MRYEEVRDLLPDLSALGGLLARYWQEVRPLATATADAQEPRRGQFLNAEVARRMPAPQTLVPPDEFTPEERINIAVYERVNRSVVNINTKVRTEAFFFLEVPTEGMGSGSILDKSGHILTNYHVVDGAKEIEVSLFNGQSYAGKLVGPTPAATWRSFPSRPRPESLYPVTIGESANLKVGQQIFAIGNPSAKSVR